MNPAPCRLGLLLVLLALACFALSTQARAACEDACLAGFNTVQGDNALLNLTTGFSNTAFGANALLSMTSASGNTAVGVDALYYDTTGYVNTAVGDTALFDNTTGWVNTAVGAGALEVNSTGVWNTAVGSSALQDNTGSFNTSGNNNTATGSEAMGGNPDIQMTGSNNTATGATALQNDTTGFNNTATGYQALGSNSTGNYNTASGQGALLSNTTGFNNTATGVDALRNSGIGNYNTADGQGCLYSNTTGRNNTATGQNALRNNTTGSFNVALGGNAGFNLTTGSNNIDIFDRGVAGEANTIRIGRQGTQTTTFIAGISGATVPTGVAVIVDASGHLGTTTCSARFKDAIKPMDKASEAILALKPVTFRYKHELDPHGIPQFGLVAEEVERVNPDLVARDEQGKPYSVRYEAVNAMLLNEFLKEHRTVQELKSAAAKQEATIAHQQKQIETLTAGLQKVSAKLEARRGAQQKLVSNP